MVAAAIVGAGAMSAAGSMAGASANSSAMKKAAAIQAQQFAETKAALQQGKTEALGYIQPYADVGSSALKQLAWGMGLDVPVKKYTAADAPETLSGNSGDPLWDKLVNEAQAPHIAKYGIPVSSKNRDADAASFYNNIAQKYAAAKNAEVAAQSPYQGEGNRGAYLNYDQDQYQKDVGYTPMVNSLAELQATPGYQFQLEQGLQGVNNSAAARGGLLSGANLKAINDYAQGQAATGYQAAWERAQTAYQNAFGRNQQKFQNLQAMVNNGQAAANSQGNAALSVGEGLAGASTNYGNNMGSLALAQGQNQANMYTGIGNALGGTLMGVAGAGGFGGMSRGIGGNAYGVQLSPGINGQVLGNAIPGIGGYGFQSL